MSRKPFSFFQSRKEKDSLAPQNTATAGLHVAHPPDLRPMAAFKDMPDATAKENKERDAHLKRLSDDLAGKKKTLFLDAQPVRHDDLPTMSGYQAYVALINAGDMDLYDRSTQAWRENLFKAKPAIVHYQQHLHNLDGWDVCLHN